MEVIFIVIILSTGHQYIVEVHKVDEAHSLSNFLAEK